MLRSDSYQNLPFQTNPNEGTGWEPDMKWFYHINGVGLIPHVSNDNAFTFAQTRCYLGLQHGFYESQRYFVENVLNNPDW